MESKIKFKLNPEYRLMGMEWMGGVELPCNGGRSCRKCRNKTRSARMSRIFNHGHPTVEWHECNSLFYT